MSQAHIQWKQHSRNSASRWSWLSNCHKNQFVFQFDNVSICKFIFHNWHKLNKEPSAFTFDSMNETKEIKLWLYHLGRLRVHSPVLAQRERARYGYWAPAVVIRYLPGDQSAKASGVPRDLAMLGRTRQRHSELMSSGGLKIFDYVSQNLSMDLIKQVKREAESLHYNTLWSWRGWAFPGIGYVWLNYGVELA